MEENTRKEIMDKFVEEAAPGLKEFLESDPSIIPVYHKAMLLSSLIREVGVRPIEEDFKAVALAYVILSESQLGCPETQKHFDWAMKMVKDSPFTKTLEKAKASAAKFLEQAPEVPTCGHTDCMRIYELEVNEYNNAQEAKETTNV